MKSKHQTPNLHQRLPLKRKSQDQPSNPRPHGVWWWGCADDEPPDEVMQLSPDSPTRCQHCPEFLALGRTLFTTLLEIPDQPFLCMFLVLYGLPFCLILQLGCHLCDISPNRLRSTVTLQETFSGATLVFYVDGNTSWYRERKNCRVLSPIPFRFKNENRYIEFLSQINSTVSENGSKIKNTLFLKLCLMAVDY